MLNCEELDTCPFQRENAEFTSPTSRIASRTGMPESVPSTRFSHATGEDRPIDMTFSQACTSHIRKTANTFSCTICHSPDQFPTQIQAHPSAHPESPIHPSRHKACTRTHHRGHTHASLSIVFRDFPRNSLSSSLDCWARIR